MTVTSPDNNQTMKTPTFTKPKFEKSALFLGYLSAYIVGMSLFPFLPIYATELGAPAAMIGLFMATAFGSITLGTALTVPMSKRLGSKNTIVLNSIASVIALASLVVWQNFIVLTIAIAVIWFAAGVITNLIQIATGEMHAESERDRAFAILFMARPAAALIAGVISGALIEAGGYTLLFGTMIVFMLVVTAIGQLLLPKLAFAETQKKAAATLNDSKQAISYLILGVILSGVASSYGNFALSLLMDGGGFSPSEICLSGAVAGIAAVPLTKLVNMISSKWGQRAAIWFGYSMAIISMLLFLNAASFWYFALAASLLWATQSANGSAAMALITMLANQNTQDRRLSQLQTAYWGARIISYVSAGLLIQMWNIQLTLILASGMLLVAILLVALSRNRPVPEPCPPEGCLSPA